MSSSPILERIARQHNWRSALAAEVERHRLVPFAWGRADCALFAADCVLAMTGVDLAADFRGRYRTAGGSVRAIRKAGYKDLPALLAALLPEVHPVTARAGDVALVESDEGLTAAIVTGATIAASAVNGITTLPLTRAVRVFAVG